MPTTSRGRSFKADSFAHASGGRRQDARHRAGTAHCAAVVRKGGLEPPRVAPLAPKASASTGSATFALACRLGVYPACGRRRSRLPPLPERIDRHHERDAARGPALLHQLRVPHRHGRAISDHLLAGRIRQARPAARFSCAPFEIHGGAPGFGRHCVEVLRDAGLTREEIAALVAHGVVVAGPAEDGSAPGGGGPGELGPRLLARRGDVELLRHPEALGRKRLPGVGERFAVERRLPEEGVERSVTEGAPRVGQRGGAPHHPVAGGGDEDRRARRPHGPDRDAHVLHPEVLAAERDPVLGPQPLDEPCRLDEPRQAILPADPEALVLDRPIPETHAEREAACAHPVEGGDRLRDLHRVEERKLENVRADLHVCGFGRDAGKRRNRLEVPDRRHLAETFLEQRPVTGPVPGRALGKPAPRLRARRRPGTAAGEVVHAVKDRPAPVDLDALQQVSMRAENHVGARVHRRVPDLEPVVRDQMRRSSSSVGVRFGRRRFVMSISGNGGGPDPVRTGRRFRLAWRATGVRPGSRIQHQPGSEESNDTWLWRRQRGRGADHGVRVPPSARFPPSGPARAGTRRGCA